MNARLLRSTQSLFKTTHTAGVSLGQVTPASLGLNYGKPGSP